MALGMKREVCIISRTADPTPYNIALSGAELAEQACAFKNTANWRGRSGFRHGDRDLNLKRALHAIVTLAKTEIARVTDDELREQVLVRKKKSIVCCNDKSKGCLISVAPGQGRYFCKS